MDSKHRAVPRWPEPAAPRGWLDQSPSGDLTVHSPFSWPARGRVPWCQASAWVLRSIATYVNPWPGRGRLVTGYQDRTTSRPAGRLAERRSWEGMECVPSPRNQPEARTNAHCSVTAPVRYVPTPEQAPEHPEPTQTARRHAGWSVGGGGCGEGWEVNREDKVLLNYQDP